jgi:hypothetical protein
VTVLIFLTGLQLLIVKTSLFLFQGELLGFLEFRHLRFVFLGFGLLLLLIIKHVYHLHLLSRFSLLLLLNIYIFLLPLQLHRNNDYLIIQLAHILVHLQALALLIFDLVIGLVLYIEPWNTEESVLLEAVAFEDKVVAVFCNFIIILAVPPPLPAPLAIILLLQHIFYLEHYTK